MRKIILSNRAFCVACALTSALLAASDWQSRALGQPPTPQSPASAPAVAPPDAAAIRALVEAIAAGRDPNASDRLLDAWVEPLAAALADLDRRPREEHGRLVLALQRVSANLQLQVLRHSLDADDRARLDRVLKSERPLIESLFHADERVRLSALERIPLEKNTAAGLLIAAKLYDPNAEVVDAAVDKARELRDESVAKGLRKFSRDVLDHFSTESATADAATLIVYASYLDRATALLAELGHASDLSLLNDALLQLATPAFRPFAQNTHTTLDALGLIGDESSVPALRAYLNDDMIQLLPADADSRIMRTTGDAALLALCRVYKLDPLLLGFVQPMKERRAMGFPDSETRVRARLIFHEWLQRNSARPAAEREPLAAILPPPTKDSPK